MLESRLFRYFDPWSAPRIAVALCLGLLASLGTQPAAAQQYPERAVRIVVPYTPGGGIDLLARLVSAQLTQMWGRPVQVDNRPGAGANLGTDLVAKSAPDGYNFVIVSNTIALAASAQPKPPYDALKDLAPVLLATRAPFVLGVNPKVGAQSVKGLLEVARARPGGLNFASAGQGTSTHLAIELLRQRTGMPALHVPYKGSAPALTDLLEGRVDALFATAAAIMPFVRDQRLLGLAVTGRARSTSAPGVPTMIEAGIADYEVTVWFAFLAPAGTPQAIIRKFHVDTLRVLAMPEVAEKLRAQGQEVAPLGPEEFGPFLRAEINTWADVVRQAGLKFE